MTQEQIESAVYNIADQMRDLFEEIRGSNLVEAPDDCGHDSLALFKYYVVQAIPESASLKFRQDVEEMLNKFKNIY